MAIQNPNSSGQGYDPTHADEDEYFPVITAFGYEYSHSTPVTHMGGERVIHHTYKRAGHNVSTWWASRGPIGTQWETSTSTSSGRHTTGNNKAGLVKHLRGKSQRYRELRL